MKKKYLFCTKLWFYLTEIPLALLLAVSIHYGPMTEGEFNEEQYHTFGVEWTPEYIRFFLDGISYGTVEVGSDKYKDLNTEMYIDFIGGVNMTETVANDEVAMWPINLNIDWVRVYQRAGGVHTDRTMIVELPEQKPAEKPATKK